MRFKDVFDLYMNLNKAERTAELVVRLFGIDISTAFYGWVSDWSFPFMFLPGRRGIFFQTLFLGVFVGRLKDAEI